MMAHSQMSWSWGLETDSHEVQTFSIKRRVWLKFGDKIVA